MALSALTQEIKWVNQFLTELLLSKVKLNITTYVDNQAAIQISKNDVYHDRTKHIDIRYHFVRDCIRDNLFKIEWIATQDQQADIFTKALQTIQFRKLCQAITNNSKS